MSDEVNEKQEEINFEEEMNNIEDDEIEELSETNVDEILRKKKK